MTKTSINNQLDSYQQCKRCVMDTTAPDIVFDDNGICNFCTNFLESSKHIIYEDKLQKKQRLDNFVHLVKEAGKNKPYDCLVGVSGGVDSSWVLVSVKELGLRPLAVHMDNGWNSELAQNNIANLVKSLDVDLFTYVIDWDEYKGLMQAFFDADVVDIELLYDNAMLAVNYRQARKFGIKYILTGANRSSEGMPMPKGWNWFKRDVRNIKAIAKRFGSMKLNSFPTHSTLDYITDEFIRGIRVFDFLDLLPYNKFAALDVLESNFGYKRYAYKHYESIFTRFYQGYILPNKFNVDKRLLHLGTLVASGQMSRESALISLNGIPYPSQSDCNSDIDYFLKKMNWTREELDSYLARPGIPHDIYPSEAYLYPYLTSLFPPKIKSLLKRIWSR